MVHIIDSSATPHGMTALEMLNRINGWEYISFLVWRDHEGKLWQVKHLPADRYSIDPVK